MEYDKTRKEIKEKIPMDFWSYLNEPLNHLIIGLQELILKNPQYHLIELDTEGAYEDIGIVIMGTRFETDQELETRVQKEQKLMERKIKAQETRLRNLRLKYGTNGI